MLQSEIRSTTRRSHGCRSGINQAAWSFLIAMALVLGTALMSYQHNSNPDHTLHSVFVCDSRKYCSPRLFCFMIYMQELKVMSILPAFAAFIISDTIGENLISQSEGTQVKSNSKDIDWPGKHHVSPWNSI